MSKIRCVIVDDDALSREMLRNCIGNHKELKLVGTYHNALEAKMGLIKNNVDLVFLDVEMPEMTGFELMDNFKNIPQVVMVTSEKKYAFDAFQYDVTDFLSKPLEMERFNKAISKVQLLTENLSKSAEDHNIIIKTNGVLVKVPTGKIDYIEAMGDYIKVVVGEESHVVHSTMKAFISQLPEAFLRVHKSYIVNLDKVLEIDDNFVVGDYFNLPVSRSYKNDVKSKFKQYL
jgi:DNA-binding LytR/AlgR family response regulator